MMMVPTGQASSTTLWGPRISQWPLLPLPLRTRLPSSTVSILFFQNTICRFTDYALIHACHGPECVFSDRWTLANS